MALKYIYSAPFAQKLPGSNQNFYFRTVTAYEVDTNGNPTGFSATRLYYAAVDTSVGKGWVNGDDKFDGFDQGRWVFAGVTDTGGKEYVFRRYTQEDKDNFRIPPDKNVGDIVLGATAQQSLTTSGGRFYEAVQNAIINTAVNTQPGLAQIVSVKQANIAIQQQQAAAAAAARRGGNGDPDDALTTVAGLSVINNVKPNKRNGILRYPLNIEKNGQDYIKFSGINYVPQRKTSNSYVLERSPVQGTDTKDILATIYLPIQPTIMDNNTVTWGEEKFGILEMIGSGISLDAMNGANIDQLIDSFTNTVTSNGTISSEIVTAIKASLAQKAIGSNNNLLSRLTGAVTNPNLTLLFNSPDLRSFNFNFKLSPRSLDEGKIVRQIIRTFKELMAVQRTAGNLFLEAPCVFDIEYIRGIDLINSKDPYDIHPSLNRIKTCALRNFSVNYTPSGSYMTYTDKEGTMTSYDLTMSFTELDPVYYDDYYTNEETNIPLDQIGY